MDRFEWVDRSPSTFEGWDGANPDNSHSSSWKGENCAELGWSAWDTWNDIPCHDKRQYICERSDCTDLPI